jgi:drug/metabolite transporter (DMT)-like permease
MGDEASAPRSTGTSRLVWVNMCVLWLGWGSSYLLVAAIARSAPPLIAMGSRFVVASALLATFLVIRHGAGCLVVRSHEFRSMAILGLGIISTSATALALGIRLVPSGIAALLFASVPLFIVIYRFVSGDRPHAVTWAGVALGLAGLAVMMIPGGEQSVSGSEGSAAAGAIIITLGAGTSAFFSWRAHAFRLPGNSAVTTTYEMMIGGSAIVLAGVLSGERPTTDVDPVALWAWAVLCVASIGLFGAFVWLMSHAPMSLVSTYAYVNPVVAVLLGWLVLGEAFTRDVIVGVTVVLGGVVLVLVGEVRRSVPVRVDGS